MRPHRLAFCALGPYPGEVEIDFDQLVNEGLFLIWGRTGAGKTFLLDALCFALFGKIPGARPDDTLYSDHAPPDASPWVELEFTAGGDRWRIHRILAHERAKKRGGGTTKQKASAVLEHLVGEMWQPVAQQRRDEVTQEIVKLLGLTAAQFQQVALLPQGQFEKVLRSKSEEREELLRTLFETSIYASVESWLDNEAKKRHEAAAVIGKELTDLRAKAAERWREVFPADGSQNGSADSPEVDEATAESLEARESDSEPWPASQAQLDELVRQALSAAKSAAADADAAGRRHREASDAHYQATQLANRWDRREHLQQELDTLTDAEVSINADRETLRLADAAEGLRRLLGAEGTARHKLEENTTEFSTRYETLRDCMADAPSLPDNLHTPALDDPELQNRLTSMGTQVTDHLNGLSKFADNASKASTRESEAATSRRSAAGHLELQDEWDEVAQEHDFKRAFAEAGLRAARSAADRTPVLAASTRRTKKQATAASSLQSLMPELGAAEKTERAAKEATRQRRNEERDLCTRYLDGIAAVLAGGLVDAEPCPVCGSAEHPDPAEPADDAVSAEDLEAAADAVESAAAAEEDAGHALQGIKDRIGNLRGLAGDVSDDPEAATEQAASAVAELAGAAELASNERVLRDAVEEHQKMANEARRHAGTAATRAALASQSAEDAKSEARRLRAKIKEALGEIDPEEAVISVQAVQSDLRQLQQLAPGHMTARSALETLATTLAEQLEGSPFATSDDAHSALLEPVELTRLRGVVNEHDEALDDTRRKLGDDELQDVPGERPDTDASQEILESARNAFKTARDHHTRVADAHRVIRRWAATHRRDSKNHATAFADAELWSGVANRCNGQTAPKVSLHRWVLSDYLEQICVFANRRLSAMTSGRYWLSVHRESERDRRKKAGLGLRVHDTYTGAEREVSTLSGGETFQASLSLALGVADVVTARTGGVRLDVLFVDEGFGTLDSEALQLAMDELDRLREGGRTIGLISHVSELRERIHAGIEVHRTDKGSTISVGAISVP